MAVSHESSAWRSWQAAALDDGIDHLIRQIYARLDEEVRRRGPVCWTSGRCCQFDAYGHRLYVTGLEIAWVWAQLNRGHCEIRRQQEGSTHRSEFRLALPVWNSNSDEPTDGCPFQVDRLCSIHTVRPLGCRIFFCQDGTAQWQNILYEQFLQELRTLHDTHGLVYQYMEWRSGLRQAKRWLTSDHGGEQTPLPL